MKNTKSMVVVFISSILFLINTSFAVEIETDNDPEYHIKLAKSYFQKVNDEPAYLAKAIEEYSKAISLKPDDASWYASRCFLYGLQNNKDKENAFSNYIQDCDKAISIEPDNPAYFYIRALMYKNRAVFYSTKEDMENALKDYEKAINLNPNIALFYSERGELLCIRQDKEAIRDLSMAIKLKPDPLEKLKLLFKHTTVRLTL